MARKLKMSFIFFYYPTQIGKSNLIKSNQKWLWHHSGSPNLFYNRTRFWMEHRLFRIYIHHEYNKFCLKAGLGLNLLLKTESEKWKSCNKHNAWLSREHQPWLLSSCQWRWSLRHVKDGWCLNSHWRTLPSCLEVWTSTTWLNTCISSSIVYRLSS